MDAAECIEIPEVVKLTGISKRTLYRRLADRTFPQPLPIGRVRRWRKAAIVEWMQRHERAAEKEDERIRRLAEV